MDNTIIQSAILNDDDMLVTPIPDFFKVKKDESFTTAKAISEASCEVGIIENCGENLPYEWVGHIIYYHKNLSHTVEIENKNYNIVSNTHKLLIRLDLNRNNYKD